MAQKQYKAVPYEVEVRHDATKGEYPWDDIPEETRTSIRYRIVSLETGEVLDDAQGYGYKTAQKAYAGYGYKTRDKSKDGIKQQKEQHIRQWLKEHKGFANAMDEIAFEIAKGSWGPDDKFDSKLVKQMLENYNLTPDFSAAELLRVWRRG